jgi:glucose/mannose-6-phosphate isomerase
MGGSAAGADVLAACLADRLDVPLMVHRGYGLPSLVDARDLVITSSYSGETAETLAAAEAALARGCPVVALTTGGRLGALARTHGLPWLEVPGGLPPRLAFGYLFFGLVRVLEAAGLPVVGATEIAEALDVLDGLSRDLDVVRPSGRNEAKQLALALAPRMPVIYGGPATGVVAYRWKTDLEENAKVFAVAGVLPEMHHNEIEAWRLPVARRLHLLLLRDPAEPPEIAARFAVLVELAGLAAGGVSQVWARGQGILARLLSLVALGQWTSFYLAMLRGVDPWLVPTLDAVKARLSPPR